MHTPDPAELTQHALIAAALRFLHAVREDDTKEALALLEEWPTIPALSIRTACAAGDLDAAQRLLRENAGRVHETIPPDHTPPLVYAATGRVKQARGVSAEQHVALVRLLLDAGADPNTTVPLPDGHGHIPVLYFPSVEGNVPVARLLLERGANPTDGESVYHAAQHDHHDMLALLQTFGADLSRGPEDVGNSPLYFLASHTVANPITAKVVGGMRWLLEHGADPNVPLAKVGDGQRTSNLGEVPLHRLAINGYDASVLSLFHEHGAVIDAARNDGVTPYQLAMRSGNAAAIAWFEAQHADASRITPVDRLLQACFAVDAATAHALTQKHPTLVSSLDDEAAGMLMQALNDGNDAAAQLMLTLGWPLTPQGEWGGTVLHWAAWFGRAPLVSQLIALGAPVNVRDTRYGSSPLAWAAHGSINCHAPTNGDYPAVVTLLLDAGATRAESFNRWQESPESMASAEVVAVLRERGFF